MKGLLIKDFKLMKNMKNSLLMIFVIVLGMSYYMKDFSFIIVYLGILGTSFTSSTLSYDEFDNGYAFLFSLPVTKKGYVVEKYGLGLIMSGGGWLLGSILTTIAGVIRSTSPIIESVMMSLALLPVVLILLSFMLPFHIKFGGEKGKIVMISVGGGLFVAGILVVKFAKGLNVDLDAIGQNLSFMSLGAMIAGGIGIGVVILLLSCRISISIVKKWEV